MTFTRTWSHRSVDGSVGLPGFIECHGIWDEAQQAVAKQVAAILEKVELVRMAFCDPHGHARSKTLTSRAFGRVLQNGMDFSPGPFLFDTGHAISLDFQTVDPDIGIAELRGAGDFIVVPDPLTFQLMEGEGPRTAWVLGDEYLRDGRPHPLSSRHVLRRVCEQFASLDLEPVIGLEVEWYLTRSLGGDPGYLGNGFGSQGRAPDVMPVDAGYQFNLDLYYDAVAPIADRLAGTLCSLGLPVRSMEHESGPGQVETTFDPMTALDAADAMLLFRRTAKQLCARAGYHASFMALPGIPNFDPSGWHLHQSVASLKTGENMFAGGISDVSLSPTASAYVRGLLDKAGELCLLSVPTINGYRRLDPRYALSPTYADWSFENRSSLLRVSGGSAATHVENRMGEPCANPYLAIGSQLFAGLTGMGNGEPAPRSAMDGVAGVESEVGGPVEPVRMPRSLAEALIAFRASSAADALLGRPLAAALIRIKASELARFQLACPGDAAGEEVTEWEQREYFDVF